MNLLHLIRLDLRRTDGGGAGDFDLLITNLGGKPARLGLAATRTGDISFHLPREVAVAGGSEERIRVSVVPLRVRHRSKARSLTFTVTATNLDDPAAEAVTAAGTYLDVPEKRQVFTLVAVFGAAALLTGAAAIALLISAGGGKSAAKSPPPPSATASPYTFKAEVKGPANVKNAPAFLCYHLDPENVPYHLRLALVNGTRSDTLTEWDDNGNNGGDCLYIAAQGTPVGSGKMSLEAWVEGKKVGQVEVGALTP